MTLSLRIQFIAIVVLTLIASWVALRGIKPGIDLAGGAELRYKLLFGDKFVGSREKAVKDAADVIRRRLESLSLKEPKITTQGDDEIVLQLPGVDAEGLNAIKRTISGTGKLELFAAATPDLQERYDRDKVVPDGYRALLNGMLVEKQPVVEGRNIIAAEPRQEGGLDGISWVTAFELDADGSRRFDDAAERLYGRSPRGRIVIVLDDKVRSAPLVNSPAFHGRGQISGAASPQK